MIVGNYMLKYNFESNSQHVRVIQLEATGWELYAKVQFWKQFTTGDSNDYLQLSWELYAKVQFWKQFTTDSKGGTIFRCWELYAKVQFWKQFTTWFLQSLISQELGIIC